jgi:hypothetical protein
MTRFLSESLEAREPYFKMGLDKLEKSSGHESLDIKFTVDVKNRAKDKIKELGLDPEDTTSSELYHTLCQRLAEDDKQLTKTLRTLAASKVSAEADPIDGLTEALKNLSDQKRSFSLKSSHLKQLFKANQPKKTMKALGFRSLDSLLKRENPAVVLLVAEKIESHSWQKKLNDQYKKLKSSDFEEKAISLVKLKDQKALKLLSEDGNNIISVKELGSLIILPLPKELPTGALTASLCIALDKLNEIRAVSTYLKLNQLSNNFGSSVVIGAFNNPKLNIEKVDHEFNWSTIHKYYNELIGSLKEDIIEPYMRFDDMLHTPIEKSLAEIEPKLEFWKDTDHLGIVSENGKPVSMNILDSAINLCNKLTFEDRISDYFKHNLWHELLVRYAKQPSLYEEAEDLEAEPMHDLAKEVASI